MIYVIIKTTVRRIKMKEYLLYILLIRILFIFNINIIRIFTTRVTINKRI